MVYGTQITNELLGVTGGPHIWNSSGTKFIVPYHPDRKRSVTFFDHEFTIDSMK